MALLNEVLADKVQAQGATALGTVTLPMSMKADTSELIRFYSILGSVISMDASGLEASDNLSRAFRVLNKMSVPSGAKFITMPGSNQDLLYYAQTDAKVAANLINEGSQRFQVRRLRTEVSNKLTEWLSLSLLEKPSPEQELRLAAISTEVNEIINSEVELKDSTDFESLSQLMSEIVSVAAQLDSIGTQLPALTVREIMEDLRNQLENIGKTTPAMSWAYEALLQAELPLNALGQIVPANTNEFQEVTIFRNAQLMSDLLTTVHPEYLR